MSASGFKIITSSDLGAPQLNGISGSLINVLNYCLITGSGWLQPSASISNNSIAIYQQPSGSKCIYYVNDASPNASPGQEAWIVGWENLTNMTAPLGTGSGQFPMPGQLLTTGHYVIRKSVAASAISKPWIMYADAYTAYLFVKTGDSNADIYSSVFMGDIFSLQGSSDRIRCMLCARPFENNGGTDYNDTINWPVLPTAVAINITPMIMPRNMGGRYTSVFCGRLGAWDFTATGFVSNNVANMAGILGAPNPGDNSIYMRPVMVWEPGIGIRGRMRGIYHIPSPITSLPDGITFNGTSELAGKTFQIVNRGPNGGFWAIEISPTVETN